ncbi:MAG: hypothetical protein U5Q16_10585 [Gammaproteobacteria bacterium]|nr:hypothetical protein [Gammaproteobacteria bacterium]
MIVPDAQPGRYKAGETLECSKDACCGSSVAVTFTLAWVVPGLLLTVAVVMDSVSIDLSLYSPIYYLGVWSPAIAAIAASWLVGGAAELKAFLSSILRWRCAFRWYLAAVVLLPGLYLGAALVWSGLGYPALAWLADGWRAPPPGAVLTATAGPVEEIGWRGFALPCSAPAAHERCFGSIACRCCLGCVAPADLSRWRLRCHGLSYLLGSDHGRLGDFFGVLQWFRRLCATAQC